MDFATNLKRICTERGTTPTTVLKNMGKSTSKVNLWNNGSLPKQEMLVKLAEALDCSVMDFFADEEDLHLETIPADEDEEDLLRIYRSLSRREKHEFMTMAYEFENKAALEGDKDTSATG